LEQSSDKSKNYKKYSIVARIFNPKFVDAPPGSRTFRPGLGRFLIGAIGATSVGKTSAMYYYVQGKWIAEIPITIGSDFMSKYVLDEPSGEILQLSFVDTAGQERHVLTLRLKVDRTRSKTFVGLTGSDLLVDLSIGFYRAAS
jgi:hypothetical protein